MVTVREYSIVSARGSRYEPILTLNLAMDYIETTTVRTLIQGNDKIQDALRFAGVRRIKDLKGKLIGARVNKDRDPPTCTLVDKMDVW